MSYSDHFKHADDVIAHLQTIVPGVDPVLRSKYLGFITVAAVTVYELSIKEIFIDFAAKKHTVFGVYTFSYFDRINGRIKIAHLKDDYIKRFGEKYILRFNRKITLGVSKGLRERGRDIRNSYGNLITWRHDFAHAGAFPTYATLAEVVEAYEDGKEVIRCLAETMVR